MHIHTYIYKLTHTHTHSYIHSHIHSHIKNIYTAQTPAHGQHIHHQPTTLSHSQTVPTEVSVVAVHAERQDEDGGHEPRDEVYVRPALGRTPPGEQGAGGAAQEGDVAHDGPDVAHDDGQVQEDLPPGAYSTHTHIEIAQQRQAAPYLILDWLVPDN